MKHLIVAMDKNNAIGFNGDLPWGRGLKDDLANLKRLTTGTSIIMGRKTFESIGSMPLPNRENIVVSRTPTGIKGVMTAGTLNSAYALARRPIFVIGGGQIYAQAIDDMDALYVTRVDAVFKNADVFFPEIDESKWCETAREHFAADERNDYPFDIVRYERLAIPQ